MSSYTVYVDNDVYPYITERSNLYNIEVGCGGGIRKIYPTPEAYKWTVATGIHTYIVEADDARDALDVLDSQPRYNDFCCGGNWIWDNYPEPIRRK